MTPFMEQHIRTVKEHIIYLEECHRNPDQVDPILLTEKVRNLKRLYRTADTKQQIDYFLTAVESMTILERDNSVVTCKIVAAANLYNLRWHLNYLEMRFDNLTPTL